MFHLGRPQRSAIRANTARNCPRFWPAFATPLLPPNRCRRIPLLTRLPSLPSESVAVQSGSAWIGTVAGSGIRPRLAASSAAHASPVAHLSSTGVAAGSSATSSRFAGAAPAKSWLQADCKILHRRVKDFTRHLDLGRPEVGTKIRPLATVRVSTQARVAPA